MQVGLWLLFGCPVLSDDDLAGRRDLDGDGAESMQFGGDDCDDNDASVFPGANDVWYDGTDADCAKNSDFDQDGDGYESSEYGGDDCDDTSVDFHPGAAESDCTDETDYNCDGSSPFVDGDSDLVPECVDCDDTNPAVGSSLAWYPDADGDSFGATDDPEYSCTPSDGRIADGTDCDDTNAAIYPGATEYCGGVDHDCDGEGNEDNSVDRVTFYADADGDGYGNESGPLLACVAPPGFVCASGDCDDTDPLRHPNAIEWACNEQDDDCDGDAPVGTLFVPEDYNEIQEAIDVAVDGDVVCIAAGTYEENLEISRPGITIEGAGAGETILDGTGRRRVVNVYYADRTTLRGFTAMNGANQSGAGVLVDHALEFLGEDLELAENSNANGFNAYTSDIRLRYVTVRDNDSEGYIGEGGGVWIAQSTGSLDHVLIAGNEMLMQDGCTGAGMYVQASVLDIQYLVVAGNRCTSSDDGLPTGGAGVGQYGSSTITLSQAVLVGNVSDSGAGGSGGGNWWLDNGSESLTAINVVNVGHVSDTDDCGGWCGEAFADWTLRYTNTWGNGFYDFAMADPSGANGNISVDPMFSDISAANPMDWDYRLATGSPLIDGGDPSVLDPDCSPSDMGIYGGPSGTW